MLILTLLNDAVFSAIPAIGFAMVFNVPKRFLSHCGMAAALAHAFRTLLLHHGVAIEWASFAAAAFIGIMAIMFAKRYLAPPLMLGVAACIPMLPGVFAFDTVTALIQLTSQSQISHELTDAVISNGLKTVFIIAALSGGLAMPSLLFYRNKKII
ncbi:threonine/serine exporter family protein [Parashewanella tropica]|uniref:threonine/serine exporter family protein n=1 Tax=Parashewanella tropica TaxID=2547970 RepID=UPI00105970A8|nr:threonine/serine exporter family protein [Parashewanella tropica]